METNQNPSTNDSIVSVETSDEQSFYLSKDVVKQIGYVKNLLEDLQTEAIKKIRLDLESRYFEIMITYAKLYSSFSEEKKQERRYSFHLIEEDKKFLESITKGETEQEKDFNRKLLVLKLLKLCDFLNFIPLFELCGKEIANIAKDKTISEFIGAFHLSPKAFGDAFKKSLEESLFLKVEPSDSKSKEEIS